LLLQDTHGEVCPANWTEGASTIKPDPKGSLEYFQKVDKATNGHANGHANGTKKRAAAVDDGDNVKKTKYA
jgi:hypothetical protein